MIYIFILWRIHSSKNLFPFAAVQHENFFMKFVSLFQYDDEKKQENID